MVNETEVDNADSKTQLVYSLSEIETFNKSEKCWVVIHDKVYDVTKFLDEHPGGSEVLLEQGGKDATENFEDVGHSTDAREMMKDYYVGELTEEDKKHLKEKRSPLWSSELPSEKGRSWSSWFIPMGLALVASLVYRFYMQTHTT